MEFGKVGRRVVEASFEGGDIVSDGGAPLLRLVDERIGLTRAAARVFADRRCAASVRHSIHSLLAQRVYGLCCDGEDVSDNTDTFVSRLSGVCQIKLWLGHFIFVRPAPEEKRKTSNTRTAAMCSGTMRRRRLIRRTIRTDASAILPRLHDALVDTASTLQHD